MEKNEKLKKLVLKIVRVIISMKYLKLKILILTIFYLMKSHTKIFWFMIFHTKLSLVRSHCVIGLIK